MDEEALNDVWLHLLLEDMLGCSAKGGLNLFPTNQAGNPLNLVFGEIIVNY